MFQRKLWNFRNMKRSSVPTKRISRIFDIVDLKSDHFCDLLRPFAIKGQGQKINSVIFTLGQAYLSGIISLDQLWTIRVKYCISYPSKGYLRSPEVTNRHLPITFDQKEVETWDWYQYVRLGQVNRLMCSMTHIVHHVTLAWFDLRSNFDLGLSMSLYMVRRALTRQTRWYQNRCSTFKIKYFIVEKRFWKILELWPLMTSILTWAKKGRKWFRNDFSQAFEHCFSFFYGV